MWRKLAGLGMLGVIMYILHVVLGGILWEGYSHLMQPISDLTASGAPDRELLTAITSLYGILCIIFAFSAYMIVRKSGSKLLKTGFMMFFLMHIVSISYNFFPEDLHGAPMTFTGFMHYVVTAAIVPLTILSVLFVGLGLRKAGGFGGEFGSNGSKSFRGLSTYSIITSIILFTAGGLTVLIMAQGWDYFGLFERLNIGSLQLWTFVMSLRLFTLQDNKNILTNKGDLSC